MKSILLFILILSSQLCWSNSGRHNWQKASLSMKAQILQGYREFFQQLSQEEAAAYQAWQIKQTSILELFIHSAWASNMDCIYAGWPSKRIGKFCSSPARQNPDYNNGTCAGNEMQCQPLLFGKSLCVPVSTREQRNMAFSNCNAKFKATKKSNEDLIREILKDGKEPELLELMDFANQICKSGKQAGTGMCNRLIQVLDKIKTHIPSPKQESVQLATDTRLHESKLDETKAVQAAVILTNQSMDVIEKANVAEQAEDCPPDEVKKITPITSVIEEKVEEKVELKQEEIKAAPETKIEPKVEKRKTAYYTPQQALADINNGKLTFLGRDKFPGHASNRTCVFKSQSAYVLYHNCLSNRNETPATDIDVISFDGGMVHYYVENYYNPERISRLDRSKYDGTWNVDFVQSPAPGDKMNVTDLINYKTNYNNTDGACWIGKTGEAKNMNSTASCYGKAKVHQAEWAPAAESFWKSPGEEWKATKQMLRGLVETVPF